MRYWRLFFVSFLLTFSIAGCHRKVERALPPPQAQAPIVSTLPAMPPLDLEPVILAQSAAEPAAPPPVEAPPPKKHAAKVHRRRTPAKAKPEGESTETHTPAATPATTIIGQLSAEDATATPSDVAQTQHLIDTTENKLKKLSTRQQTEHKDSVAQVASFLSQARQALSMNDVVGAQTLANKARILVDELSK
ncbi:MAG TPA: hypothetical protein VMV98_04805 [Acidobacteriaceae bacterium]|nr:hypothetical protein [Acidobacteriaceae bacterium]